MKNQPAENKNIAFLNCCWTLEIKNKKKKGSCGILRRM